MSSNHFKYFRVKNFKRFKDFEVKNIGQFNLILGDNNVGKTSLLEAFMFEKNFTLFHNYLLLRVKQRRIGSEFSGGVWQFFVNTDTLVQESYIETEFHINQDEQVNIWFDKETKRLEWNSATAFIDRALSGEKAKERWVLPNSQTLTYPSDLFAPLISNFEGHDYSLTRQYSKLIQSKHKKLKKNLIDGLKKIDPSIVDLEIENVSTNQPLLTIESSKSASRNLLATYGDGLISIFKLLVFIELFSERRLMIDEIDAGIHHSRMKDYWKTAIESSKNSSVQLFATTHNKECIESFEEALKELGESYTEKARTITLKENSKTGDVTAYTNEFSVLEHALELGNDLR
ncbi:MAG: AAA family ATPase [Cyclobacteriaceae bacterium]